WAVIKPLKSNKTGMNKSFLIWALPRYCTGHVGDCSTGYIYRNCIPVENEEGY
ncbi:MAG: hypothetical protein ACI9P8_001901, partial [Bacteroidia bacterium]